MGRGGGYCDLQYCVIVSAILSRHFITSPVPFNAIIIPIILMSLSYVSAVINSSLPGWRRHSITAPPIPVLIIGACVSPMKACFCVPLPLRLTIFKQVRHLFYYSAIYANITPMVCCVLSLCRDATYDAWYEALKAKADAHYSPLPPFGTGDWKLWPMYARERYGRTGAYHYVGIDETVMPVVLRWRGWLKHCWR